MAKAQTSYKLYKTHIQVHDHFLTVVEDDVSHNLWHIRMTHIREKRLNTLANKSLILFVKGISINYCDYHLLEKHNRFSLIMLLKEKRIL